MLYAVICFVFVEPWLRARTAAGIFLNTELTSDLSIKDIGRVFAFVGECPNLLLIEPFFASRHALSKQAVCDQWLPKLYEETLAHFE